MSDNTTHAEKQKKLLEDRLAVELKKNRDAWVASEKVRKERMAEEASRQNEEYRRLGAGKPTFGSTTTVR